METLSSKSVDGKTQRGGKYLTFVLGGEEYGVGILKVREIIKVMDITAMPCVPSYVRGVINLRGQVIAVVDLRRKFGLEDVAQTEHTCIIVVEMAHDGRKLCMGIVVDRVSEVLNILAENVEDAPSFGCGVNTDFIVGLGKVGQSVKILLDIDQVLSAEEMLAVGKLQKAA